jgi:hypothetical protein
MQCLPGLPWRGGGTAPLRGTSSRAWALWTQSGEDLYLVSLEAALVLDQCLLPWVLQFHSPHSAEARSVLRATGVRSPRSHALGS